MTEFSQKINDLLDRQPEKPAIISRMSGISQDEISKYKRGDRFPMNSEKVDALLSVLRCSAAVRRDIKNTWKQEYMARKYKDSDAWECMKEISGFLQNEGLASDISRCDENSRFYPDGGVIRTKLDVRRYLEAFLNSKQERQIKIWGNEFFTEELSTISYSKETQYTHLVYSENMKKTSKWVHLICGMLSRMLSHPLYHPLIIYGNNGWTGQLFSGVIISQNEALLISEDAEHGMILKEPAQIGMLEHYFEKMCEKAKPIVTAIKREDWYRTAEDDAIFIQSWLELERVSKRKGICYVTTNTVEEFVQNSILWDCRKNKWYQYKSRSGKRNILESILNNSNVILIDSDLIYKTDFSIAFCENRFLCISIAGKDGIRRYEICEPELVKWLGCTLKEIDGSDFVMDEQEKHRFISQLIEREN